MESRLWCEFHFRLLYAIVFLGACTVSRTQQTIFISSLLPPATADYDYVNPEKKFMPVAIVSIQGLPNLGSSFSASDAGWCVGESNFGFATIPLQFQMALGMEPPSLVQPFWFHSRSTGPRRVSSIASGNTFCFFTDKITSFQCGTLESSNKFALSAASIASASFPYSNSPNFALVDLKAVDGSTYAFTAFTDVNISSSLAYTQLLRLEDRRFVPAGGPYIWNDITPTNLPSDVYSGHQRLALGHNGSILVAGYPSDSDSSGLLKIYSIPNNSNLTLSSRIIGDTNSSFGFSVAIKDGFLAVGAPGSFSKNGSVYVFRLHANGTVSPICSIIDSVAHSKFGQSVFIEIDPIRSPYAFHVMVTSPVMVFRPDRTFKYLTVAAIRVDLKTSACFIAGSVQWPTIIGRESGSPSDDAASLTGVVSSSGQILTFLRQPNADNQAIQSVFCLPNYFRTSTVYGSRARSVYSCLPCEKGKYSLGGITPFCIDCPLPDPRATVEWGFDCLHTCPPGSYRPGTCVFDCDVSNSRLNNTIWMPLPPPTCILTCSAGYYNSSGTCKSCQALVSHSKFVGTGSCLSSCLPNFFWADGSQELSRYNHNSVMCVNCSEQNRILGNAPPTNGFWQDNSTVCTFSCNLGYLKSGSGCDPCQSKPAQSVWIPASQCQFVCNFGHFGRDCLRCSDFKFANGISSPANAHWVDEASTCDWVCNAGYNNNADSNRCCPNGPIENGVLVSANSASCNFVCNPGFVWSNSSLSCGSCPSISANSTFTQGCSFTCKVGFIGNPCVSCLDYVSTAVLPPGGVWNLSTCGLSCMPGYELLSDICCPLQIPQNAARANSTISCNYKCKEGYRWDSASLSCVACPAYDPIRSNNTIWNTNCSYSCVQNTLVPPNSDHFECVSCSECKHRCLPSDHPSPFNVDDVVWTFRKSSLGSMFCDWSCPDSMPAKSGARCCNSLPSAAYMFSSNGSCSVGCSQGFDSLADPRNSQFQLVCVPCSLSYRAALAPSNGYLSDVATSGNGQCEYMCNAGFKMFNSNGVNLCCKLNEHAVLKAGATSCNDWECPDKMYKFNEDCYDISSMTTVCAKNTYCSQCLTTPGCGWCHSSRSCSPGTFEGSSSLVHPCANWKFGSCADDCIGRSCEYCTNIAAYSSESAEKCSWCSSTAECIRSETAGKSCPVEQTFSSLEKCVTACSAYKDCSSCASSAGCTYCSGKSICLSNTQYSFLSDDSRRYNYFCDKVYGKHLPGSCPSLTDNVYMILIVALGSLCCGCFLWFLCSRSNFIRALLGSCRHHRDQRGDPAGDQEMGSIQYSGQGLDPNILIEFPIIKYHKKSDSNIRFHGDGANPSCSVCLGDFEVGDNLRILPCAHSFHQSCIDEWFKVGTDCPLCKADFQVAAQPRVGFGRSIQHHLRHPVPSQNFSSVQPGARPFHIRSDLESDNDVFDVGLSVSPSAVPSRPRNGMIYAVGGVIGNQEAASGLPSSHSDSAPPPPRHRRHIRRPSATVNSLWSKCGFPMPAFQTHNFGAAALSSSGNSASIRDYVEAAAIPPSLTDEVPGLAQLQAVGNSNRSPIQPVSGSSIAYNTFPLEQVPSNRRSVSPRDRMEQA